jgi:SPP1 gp7 family putative phage head morphogenesis protein
MNDYYEVLINAWDDKVKESARYAITELAKTGKDKRVDKEFLSGLDFMIRTKLGHDFAVLLDEPVKTFCDLSYKLSSEEDQFIGMKISFTPMDQQNIEMIKSQQVFWLKNHYDSAVSKKMQDVLNQAFENNLTNEELADNLQDEFKDIMKAGRPYFEGLAEHTGLRIREFGRLKNYEKIGATHYKIVAVMDERTSDICRALDGKIFPLQPALKTMEAMFKIQENYSFEEAKDHLKELAPFVREDQIETDSQGNPIGVRGSHTPFPPFHWRCRTRTVVIM